MQDLIIYRSKYGATKEYADWVGEALKTEPTPVSAVKPEMLVYADRIIIGTPVYLGRMLMRNWIAQNQRYLLDKPVYLFVVCGTPASASEKTTKIIKDNLPPSVQDKFRIYFLPGRVMPQKLSWIDRVLIRMATRGKKRASASETLTVGVDYVKKENLATMLGTIDRLGVTSSRRVETANTFLL